MHAQVPQYLDIEDKIVGPLSLKQFLYLLLGGGFLFVLYNTLNFPIFILIALPVAFFILLLVFYKIGNQKFSQFVGSFLTFISKPNIYAWKKLSPKKPGEEPVPKIIKKVEPFKKPPEDELEEIEWRIEIKK